MKKPLLFLLCASVFFSSVGFSQPCNIQVQRTCQKDKNCRTQETRTEFVNSVDECREHAKKLCEVYVADEVADKKVNASFGGQPIEGGKDLCR